MRHIARLLSAAAMVAAALLSAHTATAGEILGVSVTPNPIVDPSKPFTVNVTGKGDCDHLVVYLQATQGGLTSKSKLWEKKDFSFSVPPRPQGTISSPGQGVTPGKKIVSAEPGPASRKCGTKSATVALDVYEKPPVATPLRLPAATSGKKPVNPATIRGFNPQPEPPAVIKGFNPQPEPPANPGAQFPPNPVLPAVK